MADRFTYDVFLSHNSRDKPRVRGLAEELRDAGLRVWFDEWVIKPGDDIYLAIERGLEAARVQVLCLSPAALGSEWVALDAAPCSSAIRPMPAGASFRCCWPTATSRTHCGATSTWITAGKRRRRSLSYWPPADPSRNRPRPRRRAAREEAGAAAGAGRAAGCAGTQAYRTHEQGLERGRQPGWDMGGVRLLGQNGQDLGVWRPVSAGQRWSRKAIRQL